MFFLTKQKPSEYDDCLNRARSEVREYIKAILDPGADLNQVTFGKLAKDFIEQGMVRNLLVDKTEKHPYKETMIKTYNKIINNYIFFNQSKYIHSEK